MYAANPLAERLEAAFIWIEMNRLFGQFLGNCQRQVFLLGAFVLADAAGVLAAVSGVKDYGVESQVGSVLGGSCNIHCN